MTEGPILSKLFRFMLPITVINVINLLYNTIDSALLGKSVGDDAVAAVGATSAIFQLIYTLVGGLCNGVNVQVARAVGAKDPDRARQVTGTAMIAFLVIGFAILAAVYPLAPTFLRWTNCDPDVLPLAATYLRINFLSLPLQWLYGYMASAIRAAGNSTRSMTILLFSGACKVGMNFIFLRKMDMGIEGAALATLFSQVIAVGIILFSMLREKDAPYSLERKNLRIRKDIFWAMIRYGLPSGMSGVFFYLSSTIVQTAVNSMGKTVMTANSVASRFDAFIYAVGSAVAGATMAFVGQNIGAKKPDRVKKSTGVAVALATTLSLSLGIVFVVFAEPLCGLITNSPEVIEIAKERMILLCLTFFLTSIMEILSASLTALGYYRNNLCVGFAVGLCARAAYVLFIWPSFNTLGSLYVVMPITSILASLEYIIVLRKSAIPRLEQRILAGEDVSRVK